MTGNPYFAPALMPPMTGYPDPTRMRGLSPTATGMYINAIAHFPFFTDPYVPGTGSRCPDDHRSDRADINIDLGTCGIRIRGNDQTS